MKTAYIVTQVYSVAHGTTQLANCTTRVESSRSYWEAASIVVEAGLEKSTDGSSSTIVVTNKDENAGQGVSQVTFRGAVYIVQVCK